LANTILSLKLGATQPQNAPAEVIKALRSVEVVHGCRCPSGFRLSFEAERYPAVAGTLAEFPLVETGLLDPFVRVQVLVQMDATAAQVLMDGFITRQELVVGSDTQKATITVMGEDVSVKMDLFELSAEYQSLADSAIVNQILARYSSLGITPSVTAPSGESAPQSYVPQQNSTDRYYLQMLAARHGYLFYVLPAAQAGKNTAYWGPPVTTGTRQTALTTNMGRQNNVRSIAFTYDALAPTLTYGMALDMTQTPAKAVAIAAGSATQKPGLASTAAIPSSVSSLAQTPASFSSQLSTLGVRGTLFMQPGFNPTDAQGAGQAKTNRSVQEVVMAEGEVDTATYGQILAAPGLVDVRGVGNRYDGTYYVKQVTHNLSLEQGEWKYLQKFVLSRDGVGSTITTVQSTGAGG
jgi:hypothetical protein